MRKITDMLTAVMLSLFVGFSVVSCGEDYVMVDSGNMNPAESVLPDNWITLTDNSPISIGYEGGKLELDYTLAAGLDQSVVYVINSDDWCNGYIQNNRLVIDVELSGDVNGRSSKLFLAYDQNHQVELLLTQGKAPVVPVIGFDLSMIPASINMDELIDLSTVITVLPLDASFKELRFELMDGEEFVEISEAGVAKGINAGKATIKVKAANEEGVAGNGIEQEFILMVKGDILYDRSAWTVTIPYQYTADKETGMPEHLFDGKTTTFLSLAKPGKGNNSGGVTPSFTIDLQEELIFNYFYLAHRSNQTSVGLRLHEAQLWGSYDNVSFEKIGDKITLDTSSDAKYSFEEVTYRYLKVEYTGWATTSNTIQVSEFSLGRVIE